MALAIKPVMKTVAAPASAGRKRIASSESPRSARDRASKAIESGGGRAASPARGVRGGAEVDSARREGGRGAGGWGRACGGGDRGEVVEEAEPGMREWQLAAIGTPNLPSDSGMHRFTWDLRYPGPWAANERRSGQGGPLVPPGTYTATLMIDEVRLSHEFEVMMDPRVAREGIGVADVTAPAELIQRVRDAYSAAPHAVAARGGVVVTTLLAASPRTRHLAWLLAGLTWVAVILAGTPLWWLVGLVPVWFLAADPGWIPAGGPLEPKGTGAEDGAKDGTSSAGAWLFYDGGCGLCHRCVRLVLAEDRREGGFTDKQKEVLFGQTQVNRGQ